MPDITIKFQTRIIKLIGESQRYLAISMIKNLPLGLEIVAREPVKARKLTQNDLMWASTLKEIADQAWVNNRQYNAAMWHEFYKQEHLPEEITNENIFELVINPDAYKKWDIDIRGNKVLVGSTTDLTVKGFSEYLEQIHAHGASMGVLFSVKDNQ